MGIDIEDQLPYKELEIRVRFFDGETVFFSGFSIPWMSHDYADAKSFCLSDSSDNWLIEIDCISDGGAMMEVNRLVVDVTSWSAYTTHSQARRFVNKVSRRYYRYLMREKSLNARTR